MTVGELLEALEGVNPHLSIFHVEGVGMKSIKVVNRLNLVGVESFVEFLLYSDRVGHTEELEDCLIERNTGFKNREELIEAYQEMKARMDGLEK